MKRSGLLVFVAALQAANPVLAADYMAQPYAPPPAQYYPRAPRIVHHRPPVRYGAPMMMSGIRPAPPIYWVQAPPQYVQRLPSGCGGWGYGYGYGYGGLSSPLSILSTTDIDNGY